MRELDRRHRTRSSDEPGDTGERLRLPIVPEPGAAG
jgi:hypothetical protein